MLRYNMYMLRYDRIVQIDISAGFDMVNHQEILYRLRSVGFGGSVVVVVAI